MEEEELYVRGDEPCMEEIPYEISTDGCYVKNNMENYPVTSSDGETEDNMTPDCPGENPFTLNLHSVLQSTDLSSGHSTPGVSRHGPKYTASQHSEIFSCYECGECFTETSELISHQKSHTAEKPFLCPHCGKCFNKETNLTAHLKIHTGERPFSCPECGLWFTSEPQLERHRRVHAGEKPFSCSECGKNFI